MIITEKFHSGSRSRCFNLIYGFGNYNDDGNDRFRPGVPFIFVPIPEPETNSNHMVCWGKSRSGLVQVGAMSLRLYNNRANDSLSKDIFYVSYS